MVGVAQLPALMILVDAGLGCDVDDTGVKAKSCLLSK